MSKRQSSNGSRTATERKNSMLTNKRWNTILGVFVVVVVILGITGVLTAAPENQEGTDYPNKVYLPIVSHDTGSVDNSTPTPVSGNITEEDLGNGWIRYTDQELGFSIEYPEEWYREQEVVGEACFAENSWEARPIMNYPLVCVVLNPGYLNIPGEVRSTAVSYFEYSMNNEKVVSSSQYAQAGEQYVSGKFLFSGLEAFEEIRGEPNADTERSYMVSIYARDKDKGVYHIKMITFSQEQFRTYEQVLRQISHSFKNLQAK